MSKEEETRRENLKDALGWLQGRKLIVERDICIAISAIIDQFKEDTGVQVIGIDIRFEEFQAIGYPVEHGLIGAEAEIKV